MTGAITTLFGIGHLRPAPGTWASLAAIPLAYGLHLLGGFWLLLTATLAVTALGWWATGVETRGAEDHDPSEIVIDEVAGQWVALWPVSFGAMFAEVDMLRLWPGLIAAFVVFRLFDILKPGPVGWADRMQGPTGVMLDDLVAGWMAALVVAVLAAVAHLALI
ncbi:phosphatidylglycerophosphatase A [Rhodophyticola porphyridii]|uniref:phosphatidylglycerophosphatase A family protein n=1 Tax=Rhodophyticola porphyridii TaxID=1852017 RepID=UPI0035D03041